MMEKTYSLHELCNVITDVLEENLEQTYWVEAEIASLSERGHCYMELVEKSSKGMFAAKVRATCWESEYAFLSAFFASQTGQTLQVGLKVRLEVTVAFHAVYGLSFNVVNIDPSYTLGDLAREKQQTIARLQQDGVMEMNKSLVLPSLIKHIAVISSREAAGYEDFCHQLEHNEYQLSFDVQLFQATMQGDGAEQSIINALVGIANEVTRFDMVVLVRGGGSTTDLKCFDSYNLASFCAQFPLPILAGIGHTRDVSVVDMVANDTVKTPTDAAQFIIDHNVQQVYRVSEAQKKLYDLLNYYTLRLRGNLQEMQLRIASLVSNQIAAEQHKLLFYEKQIELYSPEKIYKKGYSLVTHNGQIVRSCHAIQSGDRLQIEFADGKIEAVVE